ncbi:RNA ligase [Scytonema sp. NUACC26]|uniref:RNA ligase n=1 Tax=Scytonema sp. NUACC26 TaxID=3140176 RepID=UPI0038B25CFD
MKRHNTYSNLVLLDYDQIDSPKSHSIVCECRGLILDEAKDWEVVNFPYKRFFNYGEGAAAVIDWSTAKVYEKLDGTLISFWYYDNKWNVSTRGTPDASGKVGGLDVTYAELTWKVFRELGYQTEWLHPDFNYFFELCTPYNQVFVHHRKSRLVAHGARDRLTLKERTIGQQPHIETVRVFDFSSIEDAIFSTNNLYGIDSEGYVITDSDFNRVKLKSPHYVALCHSKEVMTHTRMISIIRWNESDEFLAYFPGFKDLYEECVVRYRQLVEKIEKSYTEYRDIENQKEFAIAIKNFPYHSILFALRGKRFDTVKSALRSMHVDKLKQLVMNT